MLLKQIAWGCKNFAIFFVFSPILKGSCPTYRCLNLGITQNSKAEVVFKGKREVSPMLWI